MLNAITARIDAALDDHPVLVLAGLSALFLGAAVGAAAATPFDSEEVTTVLTSQMPSRTVIWTALSEGVDDAPPLYALAARAVHAIAGVGPVTTRLPAIFAAWMAAVVIFLLVRHRANVLLGLAAGLACAIASYPFAIEARGYAPAMACAAVALYCWTQLPEGRWRTVNAVIMAAALGAAPWWHDTAALALIPFVIGELIRWWSRSGPDLLAWAAIAVAGIAALPLLGLAGDAIISPTPLREGFVARTTGAYGDMLAPFSTPLLMVAWLLALGIAIWTIGLVIANREVDLGDRRLRGYEIAVAFGFAVLPAIAAGFGALLRFDVGARDLAIAIPGLAAAMMVFIATFTPRSGVGDVIVTLALTLSFMGTAATSVLTASTGFQDPVRSRPTLVRGLRDSTEPVVLADGANTLQLLYYAERNWPGRAVVLADPDLAQEFIKDSSGDRRLLVLAKWAQVRIEPFFPYTALARGFLVHESSPNWVVPKLRQLRSAVQQVEDHPTGTLFRVRMRLP
jgi:hypothetical protein